MPACLPVSRLKIKTGNVCHDTLVPRCKCHLPFVSRPEYKQSVQDHRISADPKYDSISSAKTLTENSVSLCGLLITSLLFLTAGIFCNWI